MFSAKQLLLEDVRYSAWANQRVLDACSTLTEQELNRDLNISHSNIFSTLQHICDGERVWLDCLTTTEPGGSWRLPMSPAPPLPLDDMRKRWPALWKGYMEWLESISEEDHSEMNLNRELIVQLPDGLEPRLARWKILSHVLDHSTFHRGQVVGKFRSLGKQPPAINRMDFLLSDRA
jgi:uncharacterized damage-inducible protein DinB